MSNAHQNEHLPPTASDAKEAYREAPQPAAASLLGEANGALGAGAVQRKIARRLAQRHGTGGPVVQRKENDHSDESGASDQLHDAAADHAAANQASKPKNKQEKFVATYGKGAIALESKDGVPALFTLAQGALESGWGEKAIGNALFGIKAGANWKGKKQLVTTTEYFKDDKQGGRFPEVLSIEKVTEGSNAGKYKYRVKDWFRDYDTVEEGLEDHSAFLMTNKRYAPAFNTETPEDFAQAVADAGYATAAGYGGTLKSMIATVRKNWPADLGAIPSGNAKAKTGGKPGGSSPEPGNTGKPGQGGAGHAGNDGKSANDGAGKGVKDAGGAAGGAGNAIHASVGEGGANEQSDSLVVKQLLIQAGYDLTVTPAVGPKTIGYIREFQKKLGFKHPDGLVEPGGTTFKGLTGGSTAGKGDSKGNQPARPKGTQPAAGLDYNAMSERLHEAMFGGILGLGTDEAEIYAVLGKLERDGARIQQLKAAYSARHGHDLLVDLRSELSDSMLFGPELSTAVDLLTPRSAAGGDKDKGKEKDKEKDKTPQGGGQQQAGSVGGKLDQFFDDFSHIHVVSGDKTVDVVPPYHINAGDRKDKALAARAGDAKVTKLIDDLVANGKVNPLIKVGKSQPGDLKALLEEAVSRGLVTHDAGAMNDFLARYGLSVDCSGYVSQALNFLMDGNTTVDKNDKLQPGNTGSGSLKGGTANFTKIDITEIQAGDTMHLEGHIRIINEVVKEGEVIYFRTAESTAAVNKKTNENGLMRRWWKYQNGKKYNSWENQDGAHPAADDKSWNQSNESNTFGRYKALEQNEATN